MKKIIVSAFEPFGGSGRNSSLDTLNALPGQVYGCEIVKAVLPVVYGECGRILCERVASYGAGEIAAVICLGQAAGRGSVTPEYVAVNVRHAASADNAGVKYTYARVMDGAPDAYFATLPVVKMAERMKACGGAAAVSFSAGTYVCNDLMYTVLDFCKPRGIPAGFVHLPLSLEIAVAEGKAGAVAALPQEMLTREMIAAIGAVREEFPL